MVQLVRGLLLESLVRGSVPQGVGLLLESLVGGLNPTCLIIDPLGLHSGKHMSFTMHVR